MFVKFNKKKILFSIFLLILLLSISVVSLFAFSFKKPGDLSVSSLGRPSLDAVQSLAGIINFQVEIGQLRASEFRVLAFSSSRNAMVALISDGALSVTVSGSDVSFSGTHYLYFYDSDYGFFYNSSAATSSFPASNIFFSSVPISSSTVNIDGFNSSATFGSAGYNAYNIYEYYDYIFSSCVDRVERESTIRQEAQSEGESIGFEEGAEAGYFHGYDIGYADGLDEGEANGIEVGKEIGYETGYESGYVDGLDDGYVTGYSDGYKRGEDIGFESGYSDGFDDGYETGYETGLSNGYDTGYSDGLNNSDFKKPGQITAQFLRYRDDSEYQGNVYFCTTTYNGVSGFRWCTEDEISSHYLNCEVFDYVYETNLYFQNHPLEFNYFVPQIVRENSPYSGAFSFANVEYRFVDLYNQRAVVELGVDPSITGFLYDKYNEGIKDSNALVNGVSNIASKPISSLMDALDFEIFGINIGAVAVGLVGILFAIWAYKKIRKILPI